MKNWLNQHGQALKLVISRLHDQWLSTLMIFGVIGITVTLPGLIYIAVDNLQGVVTQVKQNTQMTVFLNSDVDNMQVQALKTDLLKLDGVEDIHYVSKDEALAQMAKQYPDQNLTENLQKNPLPDAYYLVLKDNSEQTLDTLKTSIAKMDGVREVLIDSEWIQRLNHILSLGHQVVNILSILLGAAMIAVIGNTVRMQVITHQAEIEVSRLIGATQSFIRRPFLYLGTLYGVGGGVAAILILSLVLLPLNASIQSIAQDYQSTFSLNFHVLSLGAVIILVTALVGWAAGFVALNNQNRSL